MNVLAFDTSLGACSVAVQWQSARGESLLREDYEERDTGHAEALLPMISMVMDGAGLSFSALDRIAVTEGPGSFTGVRIGLAAARGLALAAGKPLVSAGTLLVMAHRAHLLLANERLQVRREGAILAVVVDARKGQLYVQLFGENAGDPLSTPMLTDADGAAGLLGGRPAIAVGTGAETLAAASSASGLMNVRLPRLQPHARQLAALAPALAPVQNAEPVYLRAPDAKPQDSKSVPVAE